MAEDKVPTHQHMQIPNHSPEQARMFFALSTTLGYDPQEVKERAKKYFQKRCFNELNRTQLMFLIDKLVAKVYR